jgi:hypothetical protein
LNPTWANSSQDPILKKKKTNHKKGLVEVQALSSNLSTTKNKNIKNTKSQLVAHTCNPTFSEEGDLRGHDLVPSKSETLSEK